MTKYALNTFNRRLATSLHCAQLRAAPEQTGAKRKATQTLSGFIQRIQSPIIPSFRFCLNDLGEFEVWGERVSGEGKAGEEEGEEGAEKTYSVNYSKTCNYAKACVDRFAFWTRFKLGEKTCVNVKTVGHFFLQFRNYAAIWKWNHMWNPAWIEEVRSAI